MRALKARARKADRLLAKLYPNELVFLNYKTSWELLVAVILSAQCTDKKVNEVAARLFKKYRKFDDYLRAKPAVFEQDIRETGFYRTKAKHILRAAHIIKDKFKGKVPRTMEELLLLPGVARKTANIVLQNAYGVVVGIPVDTHVIRLSRLYGFTDETDPAKIERDLMELFPQRSWFHLSYRLVAYGRAYCPARAHNHAVCPLAKL